MAVTTIENTQFDDVGHTSFFTYRHFAAHNGTEVARLSAKLYMSPGIRVSLDHLQIPDSGYRGIGIAYTMINGLIAWSQEKGAERIYGYIEEHALLHDTPSHVAQYLTREGFIVEGINFWMYI